MNFRPLYLAFASEIGEKSAPVVGLRMKSRVAGGSRP